MTASLQTLRRLGIVLTIAVLASWAAWTAARRNAVSKPPTVAAMEPERFNQAIVQGNQYLTQAGSAFGRQLLARLQDAELSSKPLHAAHENALTTIRRVRTAFLALPAPDSAGHLRDEYRRFLDRQEQVFLGDYAALIEVVEDREPSLTEKSNAVLPVLRAVGKQEREELVRLNRLQREFLEANKVELKGWDPQETPPQ